VLLSKVSMTKGANDGHNLTSSPSKKKRQAAELKRKRLAVHPETRRLERCTVLERKREKSKLSSFL
jgi:hypothetical protein